MFLQVYILLFGVGHYETEGIYSMRAVMSHDGLPIDTIIAFESQEDAERSDHSGWHPLLSRRWSSTEFTLLNSGFYC